MPISLWDSLTSQQLTLDQTDTPLQLDRGEIDAFYHPLALHLIQRLPLLTPPRRLLVAVAGPPGAGKTAFTTLLVAVINVLLAPQGAVLIQQDGWHYPNAYLDHHTIRYKGEEILLRKRKGCPETYDTQAAYAFLETIKAGQDATYPVYSRIVHDPVPHAGMVTAAQRIAIVEGNYWLLEEDPWIRFQPLFDRTIFLNARSETIEESLRQRHLRGGKSLDFTNQHLAAVDLPNITRVLEHSATAQITVHKRDSREIIRIDYSVST